MDTTPDPQADTALSLALTIAEREEAAAGVESGKLSREDHGDPDYLRSRARAARHALQQMADRDLLAAYQQTDGEGPAADALCAEIERRGLDI